MIPKLDDLDYIRNIDKSNMLSCIDNAAEQIVNMAKVSPSLQLQNKVEGLIISGMGGSAIAGDILVDILSSSFKKPIYVSRGYTLPAYFDERNLFIAISYSGNTEETLSALKEAEERNMQIICLSSGGKLREIAIAKKYPLIELPLGFEPRAAFYSIITLLIRVLEQIAWIDPYKKNLEESIDVINMMKTELGQKKAERINQAKQFAQKIKDKIPLIFTAYGSTYACGLRAKNQFNENSKLPAFLSVFPELNHNEIVGFSNSKKDNSPFAMIVLRDEGEHVRVNKRIEITKSLIGMNLGGIIEIKSYGKSFFSRLMSLVFYADILSVYVAILRGIDPTPIDIITRLKKELKR